MASVQGFLFLLVVCTLFLASHAVQAHGVGIELTSQSGAFTVDIATNASEFSTRTPTLFDFSLLSIAEQAPADFDTLWVQIKRGEHVELVGTLSALQKKKPTLLYRFSEAGEYTLRALYYKKEELIAEGSFSLEVSGDDEKKDTFPIILITGVLLGAFVGAGCVWGYVRFRIVQT